MPASAGFLVVLTVLSACASPVERLAAEQGLESEVAVGKGFRHLVLARPASGPAARLHVYIEGDGSPWAAGRVPATDPTPRRAYALELMARDTRPSAYVGRPCYFGLAGQDNCTAKDWTSDRYSERIVQSMARAIGDLGKEQGSEELVLIGYSGGGTLARLVAASVPDVIAVVSVAGNLDTAAWTEAHAYLPLTGSLNPATAAPLPVGIRHLQLIGETDDIVPPAVTESYRQHGQSVEIWAFESFDHRCCWVEAWPGILERIEAWLAAAGRGAG